MVNTKKLLRFHCTTRGKINWLVRPPWCVGADGEGGRYSQKNVDWQHMRSVKQELLFGICKCLSGLDQSGTLAVPVNVRER